LERHDGLAALRISDDGVGISEAEIARKAEEGHIGLASTRAKALASGGEFDVRATSPGTEITISIPLRVPAAGAEADANGVALIAVSPSQRVGRTGSIPVPGKRPSTT
jgi:two-component system NarL family sensor kinase